MDGKFPKGVSNMFASTKFTTDVHCTRSKTRNQLKHVRENMTTIKTMGPRVWNDITTDEKNVNSIASFKNKLKRRFIAND